MHQLFSPIVLASVLLSLVATTASADDSCCAQCGGCCSCQKVCRLVEEEKKVEIICWGCKCEDFCVPYRSERGCQNCETFCETCGDKDSDGIYVEPKRHVWYDWLPGCGAKVYTKHKLMRGVTTQRVPSFKWVVEDLCPDCTAKCESAKLTPGIDIPAPPQVAENVRILPPSTALPIVK